MAILVTIGEFSRMTHLSVKALRHYHDVGVLVPADVDPDTGYRLYAASQVPAAQLIRRFRDLEMPLDEVRAVLEASDVQARNATVAAHLERMEHRLQQTSATVASLRLLLQGTGVPTPPSVEYRSVRPLLTAAVRGVVPFGACDAWLATAFAELERVLEAGQVSATGSSGALYHREFFELDRGEVVAFLPIAGPLTLAGRVELCELPAADLAVSMHRGAFADIDQTYGALGSFVAARALGGDGPIREHYLVTETDTADVSMHRTEVCWPITHRPTAPV